MDTPFTTPMMKQYEAIKKNYQDCLLFYRLGDFYEMFLNDAHTASQVLDITLTSRSRGKDGRIPMAGVPYHAVDSYLNKLVKAGYKVAICEQVSTPNAKGIIEREVIRVVTPGTILDEKALDRKENNYIMSLNITHNTIAFACADISTGQFQVFERESTDVFQIIRDELGKFHPAECILNEESYENRELIKVLNQERTTNITCFASWNTYAKRGEELLKNQFHTKTLHSFGIDGKTLIIESAAALLGYLEETQKSRIQHITSMSLVEEDEYLLMDRATVVNLELFSTIRDHDTKASLLAVLDTTHTAMGGRMLRSWIQKPLTDSEKIIQRYDAVETLLKDRNTRKNLISLLTDITDVERLLSRLATGIGNARDLLNLHHACLLILRLKNELKDITDSSLLQTITTMIHPRLEHICKRIEDTIAEEPPISIHQGGMIKNGINKRLDTLRDTVGGGKEWIAKLELDERQRTKINSLKVRYNNVFGFYIEISKANVHLAPDNYFRKQTLVNGERFITPELKEYETIILTAEEEINELEYSLYSELLEKVLQETSSIQQASHAVALLDCIISFVITSEKNHYNRPTLITTGNIEIQQGRHPVVEQLLQDSSFVPNDVILDQEKNQLHIITGPNMAGKSVFIRQVVLIILIAQMGCFVPAERANIHIVDKLFVRSGASDVITSGMSTFMVEMVETAYILHNMTHNSLIIMDEIGRGTSTYDGISIAWAVAEYLVTSNKRNAKTLFATHYHELQQLESYYPNKIKNYHMEVVEEDGTPVFLHTLLPGGASASFGVAVAKLAGVPEAVIQKARTLLNTMEKNPAKQILNTPQVSQHADSSILDELRTLDISRITPLEALNTLADMQKKAKE